MTEQPFLTTTRRPRRPAFDREKGVETAQALFHARGYDAVSVADLTEAMDVNTPSLYAAYGSKLALFERALRQFRNTRYLRPEKYLREGRPPAGALADMLIAAARHYSRDPDRRGCMLIEAMRADDPQAREAAKSLSSPDCDFISEYIARFASKKDAQRISDYVLMNLRGLSSNACLGHSQKQLVDCARTIGRTLDAEFA